MPPLLLQDLHITTKAASMAVVWLQAKEYEEARLACWYANNTEPQMVELLQQLITALCKGQQANLALHELSVLSEIGLVPSNLTKQVLKVAATLPGASTVVQSMHDSHVRCSVPCFFALSCIISQA